MPITPIPVPLNEQIHGQGSGIHAPRADDPYFYYYLETLVQNTGPGADSIFSSVPFNSVAGTTYFPEGTWVGHMEGSLQWWFTGTGGYGEVMVYDNNVPVLRFAAFGKSGGECVNQEIVRNPNYRATTLDKAVINFRIDLDGPGFYDFELNAMVTTVEP